MRAPSCQHAGRDGILDLVFHIYEDPLTWKAVRGTKVVWMTVIIITVAQFSITYLPPLQAIFETRPVPLIDGLLVVTVGVALFAIIEIEKQLRLRLRVMRAA